MFRLNIFLAAIAALLAFGCSDNNGGGQTGAGKIVPVVTISADINSAAASAAIGRNLPEVNDLTLRISTDDGHYAATWQPLSEYSAEPLLPGKYIVEAYYGTEMSEGFDAPYFYGRSECVLKDGDETTVEVDCRLANTLFVVNFDDEVSRCFESCALRLHSYGGLFIDYPLGETRYAFVRPGRVSVGAVLKFADGRSCDFELAVINDAAPGNCYSLDVSVENADSQSPVFVVSFDERIESDDVKVALTPAFVASPVPEIECVGFSSGEPVAVSEGKRPAVDMSMTVGKAALSKLIMTTVAPSLIAQGWPAEIDLMSAVDLSALTALGLKVTKGDNITIDFTDLIPNLRNTDGLDDSFAVLAVSPSGKTSTPAVLSVALEAVQVNILEVKSPVVGIDTAEIRVKCSDEFPQRNLSLQLYDGNAWTALPIASVTSLPAEDEYNLAFKVPQGTAPVRIRLLYCGGVRAETTIMRVSPQFHIEVDAFALKAVVRIVPEDSSLVGVITRLANIYAGAGRTIQMSRNEATGEITVTGLKQKTAYSFRASVMDNPGDGEFTPAVQVMTETAAELPNGDFETVFNKHTVYNRMPSGGRYSQNIVEIFNLQNYTDIDFTVPQTWANTNAKTYCTRASNINTWYVIPSVVTVGADEAHAGTSYAVKISTVAWDTDGEPIADYLQTGEPYTKYSLTVPRIKHRAVGKLFIGSYSFNPATLDETYTEGMEFASRPSALNGFYKFTPAVPTGSEAGLAKVEVFGADGEIIASGVSRLGPATSYTAFTVPLVYKQFGVKAKSIRVMLASSPLTGDIAYETSTAVTIPNPPTSTSTGNSLWVDELTFSY